VGVTAVSIAVIASGVVSLQFLSYACDLQDEFEIPCPGDNNTKLFKRTNEKDMPLKWFISHDQ